jgi:hypothetical protein
MQMDDLMSKTQNQKKLQLLVEKILIQVSDLTFQKDELDKITQIVYARILTEKDRIFK